MPPSLNDAPRWKQVDINPADLIPVNRERPPNIPADVRLLAGDRRVLPRVRQQIVDGRRRGPELHALLDGLAHGLPSSPTPRRVDDDRVAGGWGQEYGGQRHSSGR